MQLINASIITIGDELLIGQTIDTNSAFIAQELNKTGVWVRRRIAVGDVYNDIWAALDEEARQSDIVIITGGLGPTADDITKPLLCHYFGGTLVVNEKVLEHVKYLLEKVFRRPGPILERNLKQAEVPDVCTVLFNERGTAPGMLFRKRIEASPNSSKGGASDSDNSEVGYSYHTADRAVYNILKEFAKRQKENPTIAESFLWKNLRDKQLGGYKFRRQHIIGSYIADFVCIPAKLIIEVDGLIHQVPGNQISDAARTVELNNLGFDVMRFTNEEITGNIEKAKEAILHRLKQRLPDNTGSENPPLEGREEKDVLFFSLPGVPHEMKGLMTREVIPVIQREFKMPAIVHRTAFTYGQGESMIAELLKDFETTLPPQIKLAYLPNYGMVKLRLTGRGENEEQVIRELTPYFTRMQELVSEFLVANEDIGMEAVIGQLLKTRGKTMGTAESCTGGYIAHLITTQRGSSAYYRGSVVCYANEIKESVLGVSPHTIETVGAVSEETVRQMAAGALRTLKTDYALATSGIMGPDGGSETKPVGTVWIAVATNQPGGEPIIQTLQLNLRFDRQRNISMTAMNALNFLRKFILQQELTRF